MRFLVTWKITEGSETEQARILDLFAKWQPPTELHEWSGFADGSGGMAIAETDDVGVLAAISAPWTPWLDVTVQALLPIQQTADIMAQAQTFWGAVS
jgi:hypothetical protein